MSKPIWGELFGQQDAIASLEQAVAHKRFLKRTARTSQPVLQLL